MKFLLVAVNAKYIHSNPAVYSLAAYASGRDASLRRHIEIAEYTINHRMEDVLADLYFRKPDVIGFSCYIWNISYIRELCRQVKKVLPLVGIWLGGPEAGYDAAALLKSEPVLTGVMTGEGEQTFYELLTYYVEHMPQEEETALGNMHIEEATAGDMQAAEAASDDRKREVAASYALRNISGLVIRVPKEETEKEKETKEAAEQPAVIASTGARSLLPLSEIPFPYADFSLFENRILYYESSRGCPFRCSYCLSSIDKRVRLRDMELVRRELDLFLDQKVSQVKFIDRTFNCDRDRAAQIWRYLLARDNGVTNFHFEIAGDLLGEEELSLLESFRPGAVQLEIGVQSTNPETLREIRRTMDIGALRRNVERIISGGNVHIHLDLIAGLPFEDYASFARSFNDVYAMRPHQLQLGFLKVLKGSAMYEKSGEYGLVYGSCPPYEVLRTDWIGFDEICRLKQIEKMVELYYNSGQFATTLPLAVKRFPSPFAFFEALAVYYEKMHYFQEAPARIYRYQVLLSFFREAVGEDTQALLCEALTMDIYLRENMKTRPEFCADASLWKEEARTFFQKEAKTHAILGKAYGGADARSLARMTHVERFAYDLATGQKRRQTVLCLFDYKEKNPLTMNARVVEIR